MANLAARPVSVAEGFVAVRRAYAVQAHAVLTMVMLARPVANAAVGIAAVLRAYAVQRLVLLFAATTLVQAWKRARAVRRIAAHAVALQAHVV